MQPTGRVRRSPVALATLASATLLIAVTGCSSSTKAASSPTSTTAPSSTSSAPASSTVPPGSGGEAQKVATDAELYAVPDPIPPGEHGTLLKYLPVAGLVDGGNAYKVMYLSTSLEGVPIVVTGQVVVPTAAAPPDGRVTLATAHGTTGVADSCAPSKNPERSEMAGLGTRGVANNWIVTETDYEGLGTPGRHPYLVGVSEGRGVIDSVKAASQLPDADAGHRVVIAGYSQGGHGALWANQVAPEWAPDLHIVATFAGAPATEINLILAAGSARAINGFTLSIVAGFAAAYPDAKPSTFLTAKGVAALPAVDEGCLRDVFRATADIAPTDLVRADGPNSAPWAKLAVENNPGQVATKDPILIIHSDQDNVVPAVLSAVLHDRMCNKGQVVERRVLVNGGSHGTAAIPAYTQGLAWLKDQLDGKPAKNDCPK